MRAPSTILLDSFTVDGALRRAMAGSGPRITVSQLAVQTGYSLPTIQRRLRALGLAPRGELHGTTEIAASPTA